VTAAIAFHDLGRMPGPSITGMSPARFGAMLACLSSAGWRFVELISLFNDAAQSSDIHITLDDAFSSQLAAARSVLRTMKLPATAFVVSGAVGREASWDYMGRRRRHADWNELAAWIGDGFGVGSHAHRHLDLRRLSDAELDRELLESRELLQRRLGVPIEALAYPFGRHDARVREAARRAGYRIAFTSRAGACTPDLYAHPRVVASSLDTPLSLERRLRGGAWGRLERGKQAIVGYWAGGTPFWQQLRGDYR
jgi:peptidoglycan/xylan/chitin deacetylase (PgdA/CDA1 family)